MTNETEKGIFDTTDLLKQLIELKKHYPHNYTRTDQVINLEIMIDERQRLKAEVKKILDDFLIKYKKMQYKSFSAREINFHRRQLLEELKKRLFSNG